MRTIIISLFFALTLFAYGQQGYRKTIIAGKIINFQKVSEYNEIEISFPDLVEREKVISIEIDRTGQFRIDFQINEPTEFYLAYGSRLLFYVFPGDSLNIEINGECRKTLTNTYREEVDFYKVRGTSAKMNADITQFMIIYRDSLQNWDVERKLLESLEPMAYLRQKEKQLRENLEFLKSFNEANNTCKNFVEWAQNVIKYENWVNRMSYRFEHPLRINEDPFEYIAKMPNEYFRFLEKLENKRSIKLHTSSYLSLLHEYSMYVDQLLLLDSQKVFMQNVDSNFDKQSEFQLRYYEQVAQGFLKDILVFKYFYDYLNKKYFEEIKNTFNSNLINDKELREKILHKYNYEDSLINTVQLTEGCKLNKMENETNFLIGLMKNYPEKVIYIDFWAPWCSPCMHEMKYSPEIEKQFVNKDVVFVYLATTCTEIAWKSTIKEHKIKGEHYLLTDKQYNFLRTTLSIEGIPHYTLIDKEGNVVNENVPRPSSRSEIVRFIEKFLE